MFFSWLCRFYCRSMYIIPAFFCFSYSILFCFFHSFCFHLCLLAVGMWSLVSLFSSSFLQRLHCLLQCSYSPCFPSPFQSPEIVALWAICFHPKCWLVSSVSLIGSLPLLLWLRVSIVSCSTLPPKSSSTITCFCPLGLYSSFPFHSFPLSGGWN